MSNASPTRPVRVLVVDGSSAARKVIVAQLATDAGIELAGEAGNGVDAVRMAGELRPDLVTMDMELPGMGGLGVIEQIMTTRPVPILVLAARDDADTAFAALAKGALEVMEKPGAKSGAAQLTRKVRLLAGVKVITHIRRDRKPRETAVRQAGTPSADAVKGAVAIAASTGGPRALAAILSGLPADFPAPVLVAQHMAEGFCGGMVEWLNAGSRLPVRMGAHGTVMEPGRVYVSPSDRNMAVEPDGKLVLMERRPGQIYRPSCDTLLGSAAYAFGSSCVGVILTGMGSDGVAGMAQIRAGGGVTIAQDEGSSVVFGMPKAAIDRGCIDLVLTLDRIAAELVKRLWRPFPPSAVSLLRDEGRCGR